MLSDNERTGCGGGTGVLLGCETVGIEAGAVAAWGSLGLTNGRGDSERVGVGVGASDGTMSVSRDIRSCHTCTALNLPAVAATCEIR